MTIGGNVYWNNYRELRQSHGNISFALITNNSLIWPRDSADYDNQWKTLHVHAYYELFYIIKGNLTLYVNSESYELQERDFLIIAPNVYHYTVIRDADTCRYNIGFTYKKLGGAKETDYWGPFSEALDSLVFERYGDCGLVGNIFEKLVYYNGKYGLGREACVAACFTELLFTMYELIKRPPAPPPYEEILNDTSLSRLYKIDRILNNYYMYDISLDYLSEKLFLSSKQINRLIKKQYNLTFCQMKIKIRMKIASQLLTETVLPVSEVARRVGYKTPYGFYTAFCGMSGLSPNEYRHAGRPQ